MKVNLPFTKLLLLLFLSFSGWAAQAFTPTNADIVVALDGSGNFTKIQQAINAVPVNSDRRTIIYIKRGLYNTEKLIVPADRKNVTLVGESREGTIISYHIYDCSSGKCPTADAANWTGDNIRTSATLTLIGEGFRAENLTIQNTAGPVGQALAITVQGDKNVFINCDILGYQDTIYLWQPGKRSYFENCLVLGRTDYIYGAGIGYFQSCEIRSFGGGWITAPSTPRTQKYGFVFNNCRLTYVPNSPRAGDDGALIRLGRPWHEYPKVTWLNSHFSSMIHPQGWGDKWNMEYADTSTDLELYEHNNTGPGANMAGRANWAGLRALVPAEVDNYTVQKVLGGSDNWDPTAQPPLSQSFTWIPTNTGKGWKTASNWNPSGVPGEGETAEVSGAHVIKADGGLFSADLNLKNGAMLHVTEISTVAYLALAGSEIHAPANVNVTLEGRIGTKDAGSKLVTAGNLSLGATLSGVQELSKEGTGRAIFKGDNTSFSGPLVVKAGNLIGMVANAFGKSNVSVTSGGTLTISHSAALHPKAQLKVVTGATLVLDADVTLSEFFIDNTMQAMGEYTAATHPTLISGTGKITVGRPSSFTFVGGTSGVWDNPAHFTPQLMPEAGETVLVGREIETTGTVFPAKLILTSAGRLRMRGNHTATGVVEMQTGSRISYATSGTGFSLMAPINVLGDVTMEMSSSNTAGNGLTLLGNIMGSGKVSPMNTRSGFVNVSKLTLSGDNSGFTGTWDVTKASSTAGSSIVLEGTSANAFGMGQIEVGDNNKVIFGHEKSAGNELKLVITGSGKAVLNADVQVRSFTLNGTEMAEGRYSATTHPTMFEGTGAIIVSRALSAKGEVEKKPVRFGDNTLYIDGTRSNVSVYSMTGAAVLKESTSKKISLRSLRPGVYVARYAVDGKTGSLKILVR